MFSKLYNSMANAYIAAYDLKSNPMALVKMLERGDADSSGSTMRTAGVVALILLIFGAIAVAVIAVAGQAATSIQDPLGPIN